MVTATLPNPDMGLILSDATEIAEAMDPEGPPQAETAARALLRAITLSYRRNLIERRAR